MGAVALRDPCTAYVALGANLGDGPTRLRMAVNALRDRSDVKVVAESAFYRTAPVDADGPDYTNAVVALTTRLIAPALLDLLQAIEQAHGRVRSHRNAPRTLDLDLLLYGDARIQSARLVVPHPRMHLRAFVLAPLADVAPERVPGSAWALVRNQPITRL